MKRRVGYLTEQVNFGTGTTGYYAQLQGDDVGPEHRDPIVQISKEEFARLRDATLKGERAYLDDGVVE